MKLPWTALVAIAALALGGCKAKGGQRGSSAATDGGPLVATDTPARPADGARGKELVAKFECNRCHTVTGLEAEGEVPMDRHCTRCHDDIVGGRALQRQADANPTWRARLAPLTHAPSLVGSGARLRREWVERYLLDPIDLRPNLSPSMPRLALGSDDARDIAAYLVPDEPTAAREASPAAPAPADLGEGRRLLDTKGCGTCHRMTGVSSIAASAIPAGSSGDPKARALGMRLAPDLRHVRERMTESQLIAWLSDPPHVKPDTTMPKIPLSTKEVRDLAGYLLRAELWAPTPPEPFKRLPLLPWRVTYAQVDEKVFHRSCWHCHSEPDYAIGEGGPGNSGGFGFKARGLNLASYNGIAAGFLNDQGERTSVFSKGPDGEVILVAALLGRHAEVRGQASAVRGMPLGYEPLSAEDIQLVETWIALGRPR